MGLLEFFMFLYWDTPTYKITLKGVKKIYFVKFQIKFSYKIILDKKMRVYLILHQEMFQKNLWEFFTVKFWQIGKNAFYHTNSKVDSRRLNDMNS